HARTHRPHGSPGGRQRACGARRRRDGGDEDGERAEGGGGWRRRPRPGDGRTGGGEGNRAGGVRERTVMSKRERWERETVEPFIAKQPERQAHFSTASGLDVERLYTAEDVPAEEGGLPGEHPFTRGIYP